MTVFADKVYMRVHDAADSYFSGDNWQYYDDGMCYHEDWETWNNWDADNVALIIEQPSDPLMSEDVYTYYDNTVDEVCVMNRLSTLFYGLESFRDVVFSSRRISR